MVPRSTTSVSSGHILEMQIHGPNHKVRESETLGYAQQPVLQQAL